ncbi:C4-dicarboxylate TRAP transporter substrate-binding protein [Ruegeria arenilitoris]|uniref:C4-dicarboxylate TRAP transporter substrate-binding protein n=1 Tax=Ruegeria arenilitoris TaxID=1173585 RepID=UPI00147B7335|nr:C4-dicarboxylate TRAP transporter substrate-binding protein [Ruegeria arenilitoris]
MNLNGIILLAAGCLSLTTVAGNADQLYLTAGASHPPVSPEVGAIKEVVVPRSVEQLQSLGHKVEWTEAYAGALYNFKNTLEGVETGLADIGWVGTLFEPAKMPLQNIAYYTPFLTTDVKAVSEVMHELHEQFPEMNGAWTSQNTVYLGQSVADSYQIITTQPVNSFSDLEGMKLMTGGAASTWLTGTGAVAVNGGVPAYYNNIQTGVADGAVITPSLMMAFKLYEVAPYVTIVDLGIPASGGLAMNLDTWSGLDAESQEVFRGLGRDYSSAVVERFLAAEAKAMEVMEANGATISTLPEEERQKWINALPDVSGEWVARVEAEGLPGQALMDAYVHGLSEREALR